ncbi:hypothetical protein Q5P01_013644 [Channa striata]|uniref:G-protein coupled receptor 156 n=1 Tax=Channa striata TaxID=64152 RepID=A0AA88MNA9_CHASR|nr:hypothetical protein Q5P01_013644 [Channa striata]
MFPDMATAGNVLSKEQLLCPICLDLFNQPVSIPCGHNFCRDCLKTYWRSVYLSQCPMCKQKFYRKPDLKVNTLISEVASQFKKMMEHKDENESSNMDHSSRYKGDLSCDVYIGKSVTALKSCLDCFASFCEAHHVLGTFRKHHLINPLMSMQDTMCKRHEEQQDLFCNTNQTHVCQICDTNEHKAHLNVEDDSRDRGAQIERINEEVEKMTDLRLQKISKINQTVQLSRENTNREIEESLQVFTKLLHLVQRGQAEVEEVIGAKQRQVEFKASRLITEMEQEIKGLEWEHQSDTKGDLWHLLESFPAFSTLPGTKDGSNSCIESAVYVGVVRRAVRRIACQLEETVKAEVKRLCETELHRARQFAVEITLDPDTAHPKLVLSENNKQVYHGDVALSLPHNPERFYPGISVLAKEGFSSGRFYFEVQVKGKTEWDVGVGLGSVNRKGGSMLNPEKGYWTLGMRKDKSYWALSSTPLCVPLVEKPQRIGVYVDVEGGQVSFYNVDCASHIYSFTGYSFSERLHPYFNPRRNHGGVNSAPLIILPTATELPKRPLSPVLSAVVWTLLSCGILLAFCFLLFTLRFKNNRIVKMSSPNLNILTLFGSLLTYSSGFLFAIDERGHSQGGPSTAVLQARMWTLCVGSTLMFGPILGKTWRLYRVFTQRVPDKRVIIRDIQLMCMVALLILVDMLLLTAWNLTDPIRCSRSARAVVKVVERDITYSLTQLESCSSAYSDLWIVIIAVQKGCLLLYGTYLAGLTSNVSHPPVNQSPTIITAVTLVTFSSAVAVPVSIFLKAWPNLVYSTVAGAIFICTLATNCMLFVPQLIQCRHFEDDHNNHNQMAKYFSSPSKSQPSVYSQDEIYYLVGENNSMKKLLNEKNAVIDSLQEQVNNAKDKLLRLMSANQPPEDPDMDSSVTNLNSSSTQTTDIQSNGPSPSLPHTDSKSLLAPHVATASAVPSSEHPTDSNASSSTVLSDDMYPGENQMKVSIPGFTGKDRAESKREDDLKQPVSLPSSGLLRTAEETVNFVTSLQCRGGGLKPFQIESLDSHSGLTAQLGPNARLAGFVSSEQLQEILRELSVDAVLETTLRSPPQTARLPSQMKAADTSTLSPLSLRTPRSPHAPVLYPRISPYAMRKRRPPFHSSRRSLTPACFYAGCRKIREHCEQQAPNRHPDGATEDGRLLQVHNSDHELEDDKEEQAEGHRLITKGRRCASSCHTCAEHERAVLPDVETGGKDEPRRRHIRDSCGYWDSDSSSSTDYCYYHRPYCESCLQRDSLLSSDSSSDSSDSEYESYTGLHRSPHPVVFKEDLKPTFV